ncbi:MAG: response regulator transcription factor [Proteobacteria bacterium]|nr:response regulator transcription factor [Pseudomonadota bacterium]
MKRILVVDDDIELCELLAEFLEPEGFEVKAVHTGREGLDLALGGGFCLVVLDVMLPGMSGIDLLRELRHRSGTPVLMLTAKGEEVDRIVGLEMGADDYLPKPFNPRELLARIRAVMRRVPEHPADRGGEKTRLCVGDVVLDPESRAVWQGEQEVLLTAAEFDLLALLMKRAGSIVSREELTREALGRRLTPYDRSVDVHISSLRRKLGSRAGETERIRTIRGAGYQYTAGSGKNPAGEGDR